MTMTIYSQRDSRWSKVKLGFGTTQTIGSDGCTITSIGNILGVDPTIINERLKAVNGFLGALVIWAKIEEAFPGIKVKRVWSYDNTDVLANTPNVIVEVSGAPIGGTKHWVRYVGNKLCHDPWDGKEKATSSYPSPSGYCVISGQWQTPQQDQGTVAVEKDVFENLVSKSSEYDKFVSAGFPHVEDVLSKVKEKDSTIQNLTKDINHCETQVGKLLDDVQKINEEDKNTSSELLDAQHKNKTLEDQDADIRKILNLLPEADIVEAIKTLKASKVKKEEVPTAFTQRFIYCLNLLFARG